ncbi:hypothetical protein P43SY_003076 [Pythium insidiosum]|uniref:PDZ domain-containing protein n=1 Tax=Pythium insidiosum TaxID=114742 RepID=A0AAD5M8F4_PYTIN|nr:hypothetical protein P43SY_003076 [Pythium insidiosum]
MADDALVESIRAIIAPSVVSRDTIVALLAQSGNDPNKAVDLFFQQQAAATAEPLAAGAADAAAAAADTSERESERAVEAPAAADAREMAQVAELRELLGADAETPVVLTLLRRSDHNLQKAVELYFAEHGGATGQEEKGSDDGDGDGRREEENGQAAEPAQHNELFPAVESPQEIKPTPQHPLEPLTPHALASPPPAPSTPPTSAELQSLLAPGTYEVIMYRSKMKWQVGNVFGRAVVQWVDPHGPAAQAGIHKSDVLLSFRDTVVNEHNCSQIVEEVSKESIVVPSSMRLRRAPEIVNHAALLPSPPRRGAASPVKELYRERPRPSEEDADVVMDDVSAASNGPVEPKYGLQILCRAVESMLDAIGDQNVEAKLLVDLLLQAEFNLDVAVNNYLNEHRIVSDFRHIVGHDLDPSDPAKCLNSEPYGATIPAGPLGLTVENILERTIVVDIKPNGAAERAAVKRSSWLISLNGTPITHLTHKETLRMIETASRPLQLQLILVPQEEYRLLRKQLSMNIRQQKTERPIPEQDRMSFRVFQVKIHQAVLVMPRLVAVALFQHLTSEQFAPFQSGLAAVDIVADPLEKALPSLEEMDAALRSEAAAMEEETRGEMCEERRFLLNLFASIHDYDDKGESIVIRTIQFLGWLARRYAQLQQQIDAAPVANPEDEPALRSNRYSLLLGVVVHVLESLSIIENHATWDVMVAAFRMLVAAMTDEDVHTMVVPMVSRLSISPSPTARIVPVALLSLVYPRVGGDIRVQLRGMLDRMCNDDNPLVRRAIASIIGELVTAAGPSTVQWGVQLLDKVTADSHDIVRIFAVKSCVRLARELRRVLRSASDSSKESVEQTLRLLLVQMMPMINTFVSDSSWQVRLEAARTLPALCIAFGAEYTDVMVDHYVAMARDNTVEIRRTCGEILFELGSALIQLAARRKAAEPIGDGDAETAVADMAAELEGIALQPTEISSLVADPSANEFVVAAQTKIVRSLLPATYRLATDLSVAVRLGLAKAVGQCLQLLPASSYDDLVPIFTQLLDETQDANVRAALLEEMARHGDPTSDKIISMLVPAIRALRTAAQWRVRIKFAQCVGAWAGRGETSAVPQEFADATIEMLGDTIFEVRAEACATLAWLSRSVGHEWMISKVLPKIHSLLQATFNARVTGLMAIESIAEELKAAEQLREVVGCVITECTSKIPNLRFRALRSLRMLVPLLDDSATTESAVEIVRPLTVAETEPDADVRDCAVATLVALETHLAGGGQGSS